MSEKNRYFTTTLKQGMKMIRIISLLPPPKLESKEDIDEVRDYLEASNIIHNHCISLYDQFVSAGSDLIDED